MHNDLVGLDREEDSPIAHSQTKPVDALERGDVVGQSPWVRRQLAQLLADQGLGVRRHSTERTGRGPRDDDSSAHIRNRAVIASSWTDSAGEFQHA